MSDLPLSREYFRERFHLKLQRSAVPLIYARQSYSGPDSGPHLHEDYYSLYVVYSGRGIHEIDGHPYAMARGDVYLAAPGSTYRYLNVSNIEVDSFAFMLEVFAPDEQVALRNLAGFRHLFVSIQPIHAQHRWHLPPERWNETVAMVREIRDELEKCDLGRCDSSREVKIPDEAATILVRGLFFRLLVRLARWRDEEGEIVEGKADETARPVPDSFSNVALADVLRICEERFTEPLSVSQLAALMFLSPSRFAEIFAREVGAPPATYLRRLRLEHAQTLLRETDLSATQIATRCGFSDAAQFSRLFRAAYGTTPMQYRLRFGS